MTLSRESCVEIFYVTVKHETEHAILCDIEGEDFWIPKSQISEDSEVYKANTDGTLIVSLWFCEKQGILAV